MSNNLATSAGYDSANQYNSVKTVWIHRKSMVDKCQNFCILFIVSLISKVKGLSNDSLCKVRLCKTRTDVE